MPVPVMIIDGDVISVYSHWTDDGSRIVTDSTVRTPDGDVVVTQLGGNVDGFGMIQFPGPAILEVGMHVAVAAHKGLDLSQKEHIALDSVRVLAYPPGYVRTGPTDNGHSLYWESGCAFVTVDAAGTTAVPGDGEFAIIDAAIDEWNDKTATCSYFRVVNEGKKSVDVKNDKVNVIKFHDTEIPCPCPLTPGGPPNPNGKSWGCRPATMNHPADCYSPGAAGITTAVYINDMKSARDGAIIDADIELNGVNFAISVAGATSGPAGLCRAELQNTLTHELGHLHGLEHPCLALGDPPRVDNLGRPVPDCGSVQSPPLTADKQKILDATMYNFQECGENKKESLSADDIQAICDIYKTADDPGTCEPVPGTGGGCCSASVAGNRSDVSILLAGATVLILMRRRKSRPV